MKARGEEMLRALARPQPAIRLYLLTGPDEAAGQAGAQRLAEAMGPEAERIDLDQSTLRADPARLADEAASMALFGGPRWIRVTVSGGGDDAVGAVGALLEAPAAGNPVLMLAPGASARSRLMKLAEASPLALASVHYVPGARDLAGIAQDIARTLGLRLDGESLAAICAVVGNDRMILRRELEKLALFLDADPAAPQPVTLDSWASIGAETHEEDIGRAVDTTLSGRLDDMAAMQAEIVAAGVNEVRLIRALGNRMRTLAALRPQVDGGASPAGAAKDRSVFFKEQGSVAAQLAIWDAPGIARVIDRLQDAERAVKAPASLGGMAVRRVLVEIALEAHRRRTRGRR